MENKIGWKPKRLPIDAYLSIYTLLKPPKFRHCRVVEGETPLLNISDFRALISQNNFRSSNGFVADVRLKLDSHICTDDWECDDIICRTKGGEETEVGDCINYYLAGSVQKKLETLPAALHASRRLVHETTPLLRKH